MTNKPLTKGSSMSQINMKEISVGVDAHTNLFRIVGLAHKEFASQHFCASRAVIKDFHLTFVPCAYSGPLREEDIPDYVLPLTTSPFEHFLQSVRKNELRNHPSPLVSFADVQVIASDGYENVWVTDPLDLDLAETLRKVY
jgi:hypothetical protein